MKEADHLEKFIQNFDNDNRYVFLLTEVQGYESVFPQRDTNQTFRKKFGQDPI